jgi:hypothetical protein
MMVCNKTAAAAAAAAVAAVTHTRAIVLHHPPVAGSLSKHMRQSFCGAEDS